MFGRIKNLCIKLVVKIGSPEVYSYFLRKQGMVMGTGCSIAKTVKIGDEPWLVKLGNNVRLTNNVQLITHDGSIWTLRKLKLVNESSVLYGTIEIGDNCNLGWNVVVLPGVKIGNNCIIGANSIVCKDIPDNSVVVGSPARVICNIYDYKKKHENDLIQTNNLSKKEKIYYTKKYFKI